MHFSHELSFLSEERLLTWNTFFFSIMSLQSKIKLNILYVVILLAEHLGGIYYPEIGLLHSETKKNKNFQQ